MHLYVLLFAICATSISGKKIEIKCPPHCKCDFFLNFKRATCTNRNLVMIEADLPEETEILDLSFNQISDINDHVFFEQKLVNLKLLNMSHNKVSQIHLSGFEGLNQLKTLDLSHNSMRYILPHWFWSLQALQELYLKGNRFGRFGDEPAIESKTLKVLDVSGCGISHIGSDTLMKIPNLEILDLSENILIQLDVSAIKPLKNLKILRVSNNSFSCNDVMIKLAKYCNRNGINYKNPCAKLTPVNTEKFQRIITLEDSKEEKNSWVYEDNDNEENTTVAEICTNTTQKEERLLMKIINLSPVLSILIPFIYGISIGILIGCTVQIRCRRRSNDDEAENTYKFFDDSNLSHLSRRSLGRNSTFRRDPGNDQEARESLVMSEWNNFQSTPMVSRKF